VKRKPSDSDLAYKSWIHKKVCYQLHLFEIIGEAAHLRPETGFGVRGKRSEEQ
jgi:hypothetical protein